MAVKHINQFNTEKADKSLNHKESSVVKLCSHYLSDWTVLGLIQEESLEHVVVEFRMVEAGAGTVRAKVQLQDLRLHDPLT